MLYAEDLDCLLTCKVKRISNLGLAQSTIFFAVSYFYGAQEVTRWQSTYKENK